MTTTPEGYHDAKAWLQVQAKLRAPQYGEPGYRQPGRRVVDSAKVVTVTQSMPNPPRRGCVAMQVTVRIPDGAFLPLIPQAVVVIPADMVVSGEAVEVVATGEGSGDV